jgi:hypothetical protein
VFANAIISDLMTAKWQTVVEGDKLTDRQTHIIESFLDDNYAQVDEDLAQKFGMAGLYNWLCNHVCIRSLIGARWILIIEGDKYKLDCLPVDMRWCPFEYGNNGLEWAANITYRSKRAIESEYPGVTVAGSKDIEVRDYWDSEKNEVYIDKNLVKKQKNPFGFVPFVIVMPPAGFMLRDKGYIEHEAEDLFFLNRGLYDEQNRTASIAQTRAFELIAPRYEQVKEDGTPPVPVPQIGEVQSIAPGEEHRLLQQPDITNAFQVARLDIDDAIQQGGINKAELGNPNLNRTAVWLTEQQEIRNKLIKPRLEALAMFYQQSSRMIINEYIQQSKTRENTKLLIGKAGRRKQYSYTDLGDPDSYNISYQFMLKSRKMEIANLAMANAARGTMPLINILKDILQVEDPDGMLREIEIEEARKADPAIALFEMALRYAQEAKSLSGSEADAKKIQSMMLTERGCYIIRQRMQPAVLPEKAALPQTEENKSNVQPLISLIGTGG